MANSGAVDANAQKEQFSVAYVSAVAAVAGYTLGKFDVDDDSVDRIMGARGPIGTIRSPRLEMQLKCTESCPPADPIPFELKVKNYKDLRDPTNHLPRILVVLFVPEESGDWLAHTVEEMALRRCAYWLSLRGQPETENTSSVTVYLPRDNVFDVKGATDLMDRVGAGDML